MRLDLVGVVLGVGGDVLGGGRVERRALSADGEANQRERVTLFFADELGGRLVVAGLGRARQAGDHLLDEEVFANLRLELPHHHAELALDDELILGLIKGTVLLEGLDLADLLGDLLVGHAQAFVHGGLNEQLAVDQLIENAGADAQGVRLFARQAVLSGLAGEGLNLPRIGALEVLAGNLLTIHLGGEAVVARHGARAAAGRGRAKGEDEDDDDDPEQDDEDRRAGVFAEVGQQHGWKCSLSFRTIQDFGRADEKRKRRSRRGTRKQPGPRMPSHGSPLGRAGL